eukprot:CAMPEP_0181235230 /NCGR_PEP_ID=MMETSP1096-20121128/37448_1 /TAXON_ID=156174 ORGANISM="Chrysochromulina ericina, Strain CCMP281" /NCGR_SAMPLE_ID=MMETSP1096 /ASSEMBLY_ACC=CAM_ASM_000453 /LENGTH=146 /DNA_ID=CAMNT_0023330163 /DNA_START=105 /DNA_END=545 /DNA_ORIENTATION=-
MSSAGLWVPGLVHWSRDSRLETLGLPLCTCAYGAARLHVHQPPPRALRTPCQRARRLRIIARRIPLCGHFGCHPLPPPHHPPKGTQHEQQQRPATSHRQDHGQRAAGSVQCDRRRGVSGGRRGEQHRHLAHTEQCDVESGGEVIQV